MRRIVPALLLLLLLITNNNRIILCELAFPSSARNEFTTSVTIARRVAISTRIIAVAQWFIMTVGQNNIIITAQECISRRCPAPVIRYLVCGRKRIVSKPIRPEPIKARTDDEYDEEDYKIFIITIVVSLR